VDDLGRAVGAGLLGLALGPVQAGAHACLDDLAGGLGQAAGPLGGGVDGGAEAVAQLADGGDGAVEARGEGAGRVEARPLEGADGHLGGTGPQGGGATHGDLGQAGGDPLDGGGVGQLDPLQDGDDLGAVSRLGEDLGEHGPVVQLVLEGEVAVEGLLEGRGLLEQRLGRRGEAGEHRADVVGRAAEVADGVVEQLEALTALVGVLTQLALEVLGRGLGPTGLGDRDLGLGEAVQVCELLDELSGGVHVGRSFRLIVPVWIPTGSVPLTLASTNHRAPYAQPSSSSRSSSMPKWCATSCTTVMRTCWTTSSSSAQRAQMGSR
jgi:hypothetical protein